MICHRKTVAKKGRSKGRFSVLTDPHGHPWSHKEPGQMGAWFLWVARGGMTRKGSCVTRMRSASAATTTQAGVAQELTSKTSGMFGSTIAPLSVSDVPGSTAITLGSGAELVSQISFVKGPYVVFVVGGSLQASSSNAIQELAVSIAAHEYTSLIP